MLGQIGGVKQALAPIQFGAGFGIRCGQAKALRQLIENLKVGFGFSQRFDAFMLQYGHPMVALVETVLDNAAAIGEFADVPTFEIGAGRQDDVGEFGLALEPDRLVDHALEVVAADTCGHSGWCRSWCRCAIRRTCNRA